MSELRELYEETILDHNKKPRNFHVIEGADHVAEGYNPLCGDRLKVYLIFEGDIIKDIGFQGSGCAISKASASMMTTSVKGKSKAEVEELFGKFHNMLASKVEVAQERAELGKLAVFSGVREFPVRVKCATLAWHTLHAGLEANGRTVSTEDDVGIGQERFS